MLLKFCKENKHMENFIFMCMLNLRNEKLSWLQQYCNIYISPLGLVLDLMQSNGGACYWRHDNF